MCLMQRNFRDFFFLSLTNAFFGLIISVSCDSPLYVRPHAKAVLNKAIEMDTKFLSDNSVMDYSLLVGLDPSTDELVLGIIGKSLL